MDVASARPVNHHAHQRGFSGLTGLLAGVSMLITGRATARLAADLSAVGDSDRVVDIGCGPGSAVRTAARRGADATGVDPAPVMLGLARTLTRDRLGVTWLQGTAESLPLPDNSATLVWSLATVHHWTDVTAGLAEALRVLAPRGRFLVVERQVGPHAKGLASHGWTGRQANAFAEECRAAGFDRVRVDKPSRGRRGGVWVVQALRP